MATIKNLSRDMIENCLRNMEIPYWINSDGVIHITFDASDDTDFDINQLNAYIGAEGEDNQILVIAITSDKKIPINLFAKSMLICNSWNKEQYWPRAYLNYKEGEKEAMLMLDNNMNFEKGVHQELLCDYINSILAMGLNFWKWIKENNHL